MTLDEYLDGMRAASSAGALEAAIQAPFEHAYLGRTWDRICRVRVEAGQRICEAHPNGRFVPRLGIGRLLTVCGETFRVGRGQNSTGVRYVWHNAQAWAEAVLRENGFGLRAANAVWESSRGYPHRALAVVDEAMAGKLPDPRFDRLIYRGRCLSGTPVRVDRRRESRERAHRPCKCGGWLWDWGSGWTGYANFISWRCDRCTRIYGEYVTSDRLSEIRNAPPADFPARATARPEISPRSKVVRR